MMMRQAIASAIGALALAITGASPATAQAYPPELVKSGQSLFQQRDRVDRVIARVRSSAAAQRDQESLDES